MSTGFGLPPALADPALRFVWEAVHDRWCRQAQGQAPRSVSFSGLDDSQRRALAGLLGRRRLPGPSFSVPLDQLDSILLASDAGMGSRQVAEAVCGPIVNRPEAARLARREADERWQRLHRAADPRLAGWTDHLRRTGTAARSAAAAGLDVDHLVGAALGVAARLPAGGVPLARFAEESTGDPHALDRDRPLRALVLSAALWLEGRSAEGVPSGAQAQRALFHQAGLVLDGVSSSALVLNLPAAGDGHVDHQLQAGVAAAEPVRVTLRALGRHGVTLDPALRRLFVCENPSVVEAAADRLGRRCAPLVCTEGWPTVVVLTLLDAAGALGCPMWFSVDLDAGGMRIGNLLVERVQATPWRLAAGDYEAAAAGGRNLALDGPVPDARWDPGLAPAMRRHRVKVFEEQRLDLLLDDLVRGAAPVASLGGSPSP